MGFQVQSRNLYEAEYVFAHLLVYMRESYLEVVLARYRTGTDKASPKLLPSSHSHQQWIRGLLPWSTTSAVHPTCSLGQRAGLWMISIF